ncbi:MAG: fibronectin type III domain-containing protein [Phycisphaerae bacterium]
MIQPPVLDLLEPRVLLSAAPVAGAENLCARAIASDAIELTWDDLSATETGFTLQRSLGGADYRTIASLPADATGYVDDSLAANTLHFYRVRAEFPDRPGAWSNRNYTLTLSPATSEYTVSDVRASWTPDSTVIVTWRENFDDENGYEIQRQDVTAGGSFHTIATAPTDADTFLDDDPLAEDTHYAYRVRAIGADGQTQWSPSATAVIYSYGSFFSLGELNSDLAAPTDLQAASNVTSQIDLSWTDNAFAETGYTLSVSFDGVHYEYLANLPADSTGYVHNGVTNLGEYHYRLLATGPEGAASLPVDVRGQARPFDDSLSIPGNFLVTWDAETGVRLDWSSVEGATGYAIETVSGSNVQRLASVPADQTWFQDASGSKFTDYRVQALGVDGDSRYTETIDAHEYVPEPVPVVTNLRVTRQTSTRIDLEWDDIGQYYDGFRILRSVDGGEFHTVAWLESGRTKFEDHTLSAGQSLRYRVVTDYRQQQPFAEIVTSTDCNTSVPATPGSFSAAGVGRRQVNLSWTDLADNETHYLLQRRPADGGDFVTVASIPAGSTRYSDTGLEAETDYVYRLLAVGSAGASAAVDVAVSTLASDPAVTVSTETLTGFDRLRIVGTAANDHLLLSQSGDTLHVYAGGTLLGSYATSFGEIMLYGGDGDDTLEVDATVTTRVLMYGQDGEDTLTFAGSNKAFLVALGEGRDVLSGNGVNTSYWADRAEDVVNASAAEREAGRVHLIENFYQPDTFDPDASGYHSKELDGQAWVDPGMWGTYEGNSPGPNTYPGHSVWGLSPSILDVNQGNAQDCPFTGRYQMIAAQQPEALEEYVVDLGDGTYAVDTRRDLSVRVDGTFWNSYYSDIGPSGNIWWLLLAKVAGAHGLPLEDPSFLDSERFDPASMSAEEVDRVRRELRSGSAVCAWNSGNRVLGAPVVAQGHNYGVLDIFDRDGRTWVILRNPYGGRVVGFEDGLPPERHGLLTLTLEQFRANFSSLYVEPAKSDLASTSIFYNNSEMDGSDPSPGSTDDAAIAVGKHLLGSGEEITAANLSGYAGGINGVMFDVTGLGQRLVSGSDFEFRIGSGGDPADWSAAPDPLAVAVRHGEGVGTTDRVSIVWEDGAITDGWVEITCLANADGGTLGLPRSQTFYFGNLVGDANGDRQVSLADLSTLAGNWGAVDELRGPAAGDFNGDGTVSLADLSTLAGSWGNTLASPTWNPPAGGLEPLTAAVSPIGEAQEAQTPEAGNATVTADSSPNGNVAAVAPTPWMPRPATVDAPAVAPNGVAPAPVEDRLDVVDLLRPADPGDDGDAADLDLPM